MSTVPRIFAANWNDGVFVITGDEVSHELAGSPVRDLFVGERGIFAIVGSHQLCKRSPDGHWDILAAGESVLSCVIETNGSVLVGTDDAQVLRLGPEGTLQPLSGFAQISGRERWYAGTALIDGRLLGPPLGVRSMAVTCDGAAILANVHVGGIPRSTDQGVSWHPTLEIDWDAHQVCTHPSRPEIAAAASAAGLCISLDHGSTWNLYREGLHATYCAAVAFCGDDVLVSASSDHFATSGALYRQPLAAPGSLQPIVLGDSRWLSGIADTGCLACRDVVVAVVDRAGQLRFSQDGGHSWRSHQRTFPMTSALLVC